MNSSNYTLKDIQQLQRCPSCGETRDSAGQLAHASKCPVLMQYQRLIATEVKKRLSVEDCAEKCIGVWLSGSTDRRNDIVKLIQQCVDDSREELLERKAPCFLCENASYSQPKSSIMREPCFSCVESKGWAKFKAMKK